MSVQARSRSLSYFQWYLFEKYDSGKNVLGYARIGISLSLSIYVYIYGYTYDNMYLVYYLLVHFDACSGSTKVGSFHFSKLVFI